MLINKFGSTLPVCSANLAKMSDSENHDPEGENASPKKRRAPTMSPTEKSVLLQSVNSYKHIVESKQTNAVWAVKKSNAWAKITKEFNCQPGVHKRSEPQIRKAWENMKKQAKKEVSAFQVHNFTRNSRY